MSYKVTLNQEELAYATSVGKLRQDEAVKAHRTASYDFKGDELAIHVMGACGELAVAKVLELDWSAPVNTFKSGGDVGKLQVRTSKKMRVSGQKKSRMIIRHDDSSDDLFVFAWQEDENNYEVVGYIKGADAKQEKWFWAKPSNGRSPAYFVSDIHLRDIKELMQLFSAPPPAGESEKAGT